ncbi:hypothetical protein V6N12_003091 [Hibiscus sabdariffa]|uniref:Retrotransposon Copia-like N-terminal domain-containing protein n=1 Tax=Hibiscus sabdariffa TaxID=183260 RepID=A0ABR2EAV8_9ROSI
MVASMINPYDSIVSVDNTNHLIQFNLGSQLPLKLIGAMNFVTWKAQVKSLMFSHDLYPYLDDTMTVPPRTITINNTQTSNPKYKIWSRQDQLIRNVLMASVDQTATFAITKSSTSKEAWDTLHTLYANKSHTRIFSLQNILASITKQSRSIVEYLRDTKNVADELTTVGAPISDTELAVKILSGLGPENNQSWRSQNSRLQHLQQRQPGNTQRNPQHNCVACQLCGRTSHTSNLFRSCSHNHIEAQAHYASMPLIVDSGASHHVTIDANNIQHL